MITGKLSNGNKFKVDEDAIKSAEFRDILAGTISDDTQRKITANSELLSFLIGDEAKKELYALVRKKEGTKYVSVEVIDALTLELMGQLEKKDKDIKNSESSPT